MNFNVKLSAQRILLRPLLASDFDALYVVASDPKIWEQHPVSNRYEKAIFQKFFDEAITQNAFAIIDRETKTIIGSTRFYQFIETKNEVAIGYTFLSRKVWGGSYNAELKKLMLDYAFHFVDQVIFHVGVNNLRSQNSMIKIGAKLIGKELKTWTDRAPQDSFVYEVRKQVFRNTERLILRTLTPEDAGKYFQLSKNEGFRKFQISNYKMDSIQEASLWISNVEEYHRRHGIGILGVFEKSTSSLIGLAALKLLEGDFGPVELMYRLCDNHWGKGYGTEIAKELLSWAEEKKLPSLVAMVDPNNLPSKQILTKLGFNFKKTIHIQGVTEELHELDFHFQKSIEYLKSDAAEKAILNDPYWPKWNSPWWHITLLWEMGMLSKVPKSILKIIFDSIDTHYIHFFPRNQNELPSGIDPYTQIPCHCYLGIIYQVLFESGFDVDQKLPWIRAWFFKYQLPDGGLNCREDVYCKENGASSIISSLPVFEAMLLVRDRKHTSEEKAFLDRGYNYLVERKLFRSVRNNGKVMDEDFLKIIFPRFYEYDVLRGLTFIAKYCQVFNIAFPKERLAETLNVVKSHLDSSGKIKISRRFWDSEKTYSQSADGKWTWGKQSEGFPLLESVSPVGIVTDNLDTSVALLIKYL